MIVILRRNRLNYRSIIVEQRYNYHEFFINLIIIQVTILSFRYYGTYAVIQKQV